MLFQGFLVRIRRHGVEIQIDRSSPPQTGGLHGFKPCRHQVEVHLAVNARTVGRQIGAFGNDVESGKKRDPLIENEIHHMAFAFFAGEFQRQETAQGLLSGNHVRSRQIEFADDFSQVDLAHQGNKEKKTAHASAEGPGRQIQRSDIGHGGGFGLDGQRSLVVSSPGQAGEALLAHEDGQRIDADRVASRRQLSLNIVDRKVLLAHSDGQSADAVSRRGGLRAALDRLEEPAPFGLIVSKLVTEDAEETGRISKAVGDFARRQSLHEEGAQGLVLTLEWCFGGDEELSFWGCRYLIAMIYSHINIML